MQSKLTRVLAVLLVSAGASGAGRPPDGAPAEPGAAAPRLEEGEPQLDPAEAFRQAFAGEMKREDAVTLLQRIAKECPDSVWADDALWALGQDARNRKDHRRVIYYWQFLMAARPDVQLEDFSREQELYRRSGLPEARYYLEATGQTYRRGDGRQARGRTLFVDAKPVNPVPVRVLEGLGEAYERLGQYELALRAYRKGVEHAPTRKRLIEGCRDSVARVEKKIALLEAQERAKAVKAEDAGAAPRADGDADD